jgi:hypothetical protein
MNYLIRLDDITEGTNWDNLLQLESVCDKYNIKPIIGVVPLNIDTSIIDNKFLISRESFFIKIRAMQDKGYIVAMHGFEHSLKITSKKSIVDVNNKGALFSMVNVLSKATGKYLVYSTDQDFINASAITDFKIFLLSDQNISCGYCNHLPNPNIENELFTKGYDAVSKVGYLARHPSGYFFNREMLESTNYLTRFSDYGVCQGSCPFYSCCFQ